MSQQYPVLKITDQTSAQEVFDAVSSHLLGQGTRSSGRSGNLSGTYCRYRLGTLACAIGCLVTDEEAYLMDHQAVTTVTGLLAAFQLPLRLQNHLPLLMALQKVHDMSNPTDWPRDLASVARKHGLTP